MCCLERNIWMDLLRTRTCRSEEKMHVSKLLVFTFVPFISYCLNEKTQLLLFVLCEGTVFIFSSRFRNVDYRPFL